jgi:hypothetical protein
MRPRYITATRSVKWAAVARSWVMKRIEMPRSLAQLGQQVEDLGADADVEHRHRLIGQQQGRLQHQRAGDHHPLALATGELVR